MSEQNKFIISLQPQRVVNDKSFAIFYGLPAFVGTIPHQLEGYKVVDYNDESIDAALRSGVDPDLEAELWAANLVEACAREGRPGAFAATTTHGDLNYYVVFALSTG